MSYQRTLTRSRWRYTDQTGLRPFGQVAAPLPLGVMAWLIGVFGVLAVILAAVGLYGVIGYAVSRRVREIGIRKAVGADSRSVVGMILRQGMAMVAAGFVVGSVLAGAGQHRSGAPGLPRGPGCSAQVGVSRSPRYSS